MSARTLALAALREWRTKRRPADTIFAELAGRFRLSPADRGFALELFYGTLRQLSLLDFWIHQLRRGHVDASNKDILRLGILQIVILGVPPHAAVFETVALASRPSRGFVNAILREATRRRDDLVAIAAKQPLFLKTSHPEFLVRRWEIQFGPDHTADLCRWNNQPPPIYCRINRLQTSVSAFRQHFPDAKAVPGIENFLELSSALPLAELERGECYIQDPSTRIAPELLDPQPGETVLDACAAPGGKTGLIAEMMQNRGRIIAIDRVPSRVKTLSDNLARLGVSIAATLSHDWRRPLPKKLSDIQFDRILVDAPCTNTGVMRRRVDVRWRLQPADFERMHTEQLAIVRAVRPLLKPGGTMVYSTCSLEREENEKLIETICDEREKLNLVTDQILLPFRDNVDGGYVAILKQTA